MLINNLFYCHFDTSMVISEEILLVGEEVILSTGIYPAPRLIYFIERFSMKQINFRYVENLLSVFSGLFLRVCESRVRHCWTTT